MIGAGLQGWTIFISDEVLAHMAKFKQKRFRHKEAGGIVLGQVRGKEIYVLKVSVPSQWDEATRTTFDRNRWKAQIIIEHEFHASGGKTIYLGEWHTHPEKFPSPSPTDKKMVKDQFLKNKLNEDFLVLIIQGIEGLYLGLLTDKGLIGKGIG